MAFLGALAKVQFQAHWGEPKFKRTPANGAPPRRKNDHIKSLILGAGGHIFAGRNRYNPLQFLFAG